MESVLQYIQQATICIFSPVCQALFTARGGAQRCQVTPYVVNFHLVGGIDRSIDRSIDSFIQICISLNSLHMVGRAKIQKVLEPLPPWQRFGNPLHPLGGGGRGGKFRFLAYFIR